MAKRVSDLLSKIDLSTIMFFLGILMAVAVLQEVGVLTMLGGVLDTTFEGNHFLVTGIIGVDGDSCRNPESPAERQV